MTGFTFRLEQEDGTPADPPVLHAAVPNWQAGDTIPLSASRTLQVVRVQHDEVDELPVLVVEDLTTGPAEPPCRLDVSLSF